MKHIAVIREIPQNTPSTVLPDGAVTGNGDLALVWAGQPDRTRLYISKADFWKGEEDDYGTGGNDESVYHSDIPFLCVDDYQTFPDLVQFLLED